MASQTSQAIHKDILESELDQDRLETRISEGCDINGLFKGLTPLAVAVINEDLEAIVALLQHTSLDLNAPCEGNRTALWYATIDPVVSGRDALRICQLLVWSGARSDIKSDSGTSPYDNATRAEETDITDFFEDPDKYLPPEPEPPAYKEHESVSSATSYDDLNEIDDIDYGSYSGTGSYSSMDSAKFEEHLIRMDTPEIHELPAVAYSVHSNYNRRGDFVNRRAPSIRGGWDSEEDKQPLKTFPLNKPFVNIGGRGFGRPVAATTPALQKAHHIWAKPDDRAVKSIIAFVKHLFWHTNSLTSFQDVLGKIPTAWRGVLWRYFRIKGEALPPQALSSLKNLPSRTRHAAPHSASGTPAASHSASAAHAAHADGPSTDLDSIAETVPEPVPAPGPVAVIPDPDGPEALAAHMHDQVHLLGLEKFFPADDPFLDTLIQKACDLVAQGRVPRNSPNSANNSIHSSESGSTATTASSSLYHPDNVRGLMRLALFQPVLFLDNSGSMRVSEGPVDKIESMKDVVKRVARITTELVPEDYGVHIRFINASDAFPPGVSYQKVEHIAEQLEKVRYKGGTKLGTHMIDFILKDLVYTPVERGDLRRPLLISVVTDGEPNKEPMDKFKQTLLECKQKLMDHGYHPRNVLFHVSQVGDDAAATKFLEELRSDEELKETVYVAAEKLDDQFADLHANHDALDIWLLKTLLEPVLRMETGNSN
ncbi:hypothetical protein BJ508DRAFT_412780 [Ascobolus immersus RN42]|uniref:VWFA domain-containing protein n=1 Tax=Ascobolus immersus RN42 TaxID=1160509 RepID=A0A3N4IJN6_ASCIM|nr:hypothetical protein BJ508DRAFT_412780 [Ascobolus immersus RN42]